MIINPGVDVPSVPKPTVQQEVPSLKLTYSHQHASRIDQARYLQRLQTLDSGFTRDRAGQEGQRRRPCLTKSCDPADATGELVAQSVVDIDILEHGHIGERHCHQPTHHLMYVSARGGKFRYSKARQKKYGAAQSHDQSIWALA